MTSWEEEYQKEAAKEDELYRRRLAANARRRDHRRKLLTFFAVLALFTIATVAIVAATLQSSDTGRNHGREETEETEPKAISIPDWVEVDLLPLNEYSRPGIALPEVNGVVVHYVGNPNTTAKQNRSYFAGLAESHATSASSHFIVGLEGEIILCVPLEEISYCSNNRNYDTIAIEVCHPDETGRFTEETEDALVKLLKWLCGVYNLDRDDIIRHHDVNGKNCPKYYVEHPEAWEDLRDRVFR